MNDFDITNENDTYKRKSSDNNLNEFTNISCDGIMIANNNLLLDINITSTDDTYYDIASINDPATDFKLISIIDDNDAGDDNDANEDADDANDANVDTNDANVDTDDADEDANIDTNDANEDANVDTNDANDDANIDIADADDANDTLLGKNLLDDNIGVPEDDIYYETDIIPYLYNLPKDIILIQQDYNRSLESDIHTNMLRKVFSDSNITIKSIPQVQPNIELFKGYDAVIIDFLTINHELYNSKKIIKNFITSLGDVKKPMIIFGCQSNHMRLLKTLKMVVSNYLVAVYTSDYKLLGGNNIELPLHYYPPAIFKINTHDISTIDTTIDQKQHFSVFLSATIMNYISVIESLIIFLQFINIKYTITLYRTNYTGERGSDEIYINNYIHKKCPFLKINNDKLEDKILLEKIMKSEMVLTMTNFGESVAIRSKVPCIYYGEYVSSSLLSFLDFNFAEVTYTGKKVDELVSNLKWTVEFLNNTKDKLLRKIDKYTHYSHMFYNNTNPFKYAFTSFNFNPSTLNSDSIVATKEFYKTLPVNVYSSTINGSKEMYPWLFKHMVITNYDLMSNHKNYGVLIITDIAHIFLCEKNVITQPWIGIYYHDAMVLNKLLESKEFITSLMLCKGIVTFSQYVRSEFCKRLLSNNLTSFYHINVLDIAYPYITCDEPVFSPSKVDDLIKYNNIYSYPDIFDCAGVSLKLLDVNKQISSIIRNGIVLLTKVIDNHVLLSLLVWCIYYRSPIVLPKNKIAVEYLGENYPLYYINNDIKGVLSKNNIVAGHTYLINLNSKTCSMTDFIVRILDTQMLTLANTPKYVFNI